MIRSTIRITNRLIAGRSDQNPRPLLPSRDLGADNESQMRPPRELSIA